MVNEDLCVSMLLTEQYFYAAVILELAAVILELAVVSFGFVAPFVLAVVSFVLPSEIVDKFCVASAVELSEIYC